MEKNIDNKTKGRIGLSLAIAYFGTKGYTISIPLNDTQWYDLVIEKDGIFQTVQCKFTTTDNNEISLKSMGGTKGIAYDSILNHPIDWLFCANQNLEMWLIPLKDIREAGNKKAIKLRTQPNTNHQGFETYKYQVKL